MKFSMTGQEKNDLLIQVTAWILYVSFTILVDIVQITIFFVEMDCILGFYFITFSIREIILWFPPPIRLTTTI